MIVDYPTLFKYTIKKVLLLLNKTFLLVLKGCYNRINSRSTFPLTKTTTTTKANYKIMGKIKKDPSTIDTFPIKPIGFRLV